MPAAMTNNAINKTYIDGRELAASAPMRMLELIFNPRDIRQRLGLDQQEFRARIGVTRSGGSCHEVVCVKIPL